MVCNEYCALTEPNASATTTDTANSAHRHDIASANVVFVTDPICSYCWAIEPVWRRLQLDYQLQVRYVHGGLLPGWQDFADVSNHIRRPADVAPHWQHIAEHYQQPIDPSMWLTDPLSNSYGLCQAVLAVRALAPDLEAAFLRLLREQIFIFARNVERIETLSALAATLGINAAAFRQQLANDEQSKRFAAEQQLMANLGARSFPTIIALGEQRLSCTGALPYQQLIALLNNSGLVLHAKQLNTEQKLASFPSWTLRELSEVLQCSAAEAQVLLESRGWQANPQRTLWQNATLARYR